MTNRIQRLMLEDGSSIELWGPFEDGTYQLVTTKPLGMERVPAEEVKLQPFELAALHGLTGVPYSGPE